MPVVFRNAKILFRGVDLSGQANEGSLEFAATLLDATVFGDTTKRNKGGLTTVRATVRGYVAYGQNQIDPTLFTAVGRDDDIVAIFADGITEGTATDKGYAFKVVTASFKQGGRIGSLLPFDVVMEGRGIEGAA